MSNAFRRRRSIFVVIVAVACLTSPSRGADPNAYTLTEVYIPSADGTPLHAYLYRPAALGPDDETPVIMTVSPYNSSGGTPLGPDPLGSATPGPGSRMTQWGFANGYSSLEVSLRGYGGSGGCYDMGGAGEQADVKAAIEWAASQPWSSGKVAHIGHSYDGMTELMALATRPNGLAAVVATAPPAGYLNFYTPGRVRITGGGTGFGAFYAASDLLPPSLRSPLEQHTTSLSGTLTNPLCYPSVILGTYDDDPDSAFWQERDLVSRVAGSTVPTIMAQGFNDWQVRPIVAAQIFASLAGPKRLLLGPWDHGIPDVDGDPFEDEIRAWFDEHLKGVPGAPQPSVRVQSIDESWRAESQWPPADAVSYPLPLLPGSYLNGPGNNGETGLPDAFPVDAPIPLPTGRGSWTFTQALPYDVHLAGVPVAHLDVSSPPPLTVNATAILYDVDPAGVATFVSRGASLAPGTGSVAIEMYPQDWVFRAGHRIGMLIGADDIWFEPGKTLLPVRFTGSIALPFLISARSTLPSGPFEARGPHGGPITVNASTITSRTNPAPLPPALQ